MEAEHSLEMIFGYGRLKKYLVRSLREITAVVEVLEAAVIEDLNCLNRADWKR